MFARSNALTRPRLLPPPPPPLLLLALIRDLLLALAACPSDLRVFVRRWRTRYRLMRLETY